MQALLQAVVDAMQSILDHALAFALLFVVVTVLGTPAKRALSAIGNLLSAPARFSRSEAQPWLGRTQPWSFNKLLAKFRGHFAPLFDRPARMLGRSVTRVAGTITRSAQWPIDRVTGVVLRLIDPFLHEAAQFLDPIGVRARESSMTALAALGSSGRWVGWRVIGGLLFFAGLCLFLFADATLAIASHELAIGSTVGFVPQWLREVTVAYALASFLSALMLGLVIFDLAGMTHLGPWEELKGWRRSSLGVLVVATAVASLLLALFLSLWRASRIVDDFIPADVARTLEGWALTLPIPLLLIATALIAWGAIAMPWIAWIVATAVSWLVVRAVTTFLRLASLVLPASLAVLGGALRLLGVVCLGAVIGVLCLALVASFLGLALGAAEVFVAAALLVLVWSVCWLAGVVIIYGLQLVAAVAIGTVEVAQYVLHSLMYPGASLWNWLVSFDVEHRLHLGRIPMQANGLEEVPEPARRDEALAVA